MLVHGQEGPSLLLVAVTCRCVVVPPAFGLLPLYSSNKVLLQAGVADLIPVGGSGLRCAADFLAGASSGQLCDWDYGISCPDPQVLLLVGPLAPGSVRVELCCVSF